MRRALSTVLAVALLGGVAAAIYFGRQSDGENSTRDLTEVRGVIGSEKRTLFADPAFAGRRQVPGTGRSAEQELVEQLRSVERVLRATADAVHGDQARWLVEHGRRLDEQAEQADP